MDTLTITDSGHEASRQRTFTRRQFLAYESAMSGDTAAAIDTSHGSANAINGPGDLDDTFTWEQWDHHTGRDADHGLTHGATHRRA